MDINTSLDAVNTMLAAIGEAPINSLSKAVTSDAAFAVRLLDEVNTEVQATGWSFNTEKEFTLQKDNSGNIPLPSDMLRVTIDRQRYTNVYPVVRGKRLYDQKNQTFTFTDSLVASRLIRKITFEDLPPVARRYVTIRSARVFVDRVGGGQEVHAYTEEQERDSRKTLMKDEGEVRNLNILSAPGVSRALDRRSPWVS